MPLPPSGQQPYQPWPVTTPMPGPTTPLSPGSSSHPPVPPPPRPRDTPDPGSRRMAWIGALLAFSLIFVVMLSQQFGGSTLDHANKPVESVTAPDVTDPVRLSSSIMVRLRQTLENMASTPADRRQIDAQTPSMLQQIEGSSTSDVDDFRIAVVAGDLDSPEAAQERLKRVAGQEPPPYAAFSEDRAILDDIYAGKSIDDQRRADFIARHGYFAELALSHGLPISDPLREKVAGNGGRLLAALILFGCIFVAALVAGLVCSVIAGIRLGAGKWRPAFLPPLPGGSVFIEMVAVLAGAFLLMKLVGSLIASHVTDAQTLTVVMLLVQWSLLAVCFYPLLRGVSFAEMRRRLGWTSGKGVAREAMAGVFAYFAFFPIFLIIVGVCVLLMVLWSFITSGDASPQPASNPVADLVSDASGLTIVLLFTLATLWAPFVEETVFRGALFRHLRTRLGLFASAAISAVCFGVMHGYPFILLMPVTALGFSFALMREWRGSLIAPMVAHFLHNATILTFAVTFFSAAA